MAPFPPNLAPFYRAARDEAASVVESPPPLPVSRVLERNFLGDFRWVNDVPILELCAPPDEPIFVLKKVRCIK